VFKEYDCENCGASLTFEPEAQALKCNYCGSSKIIEYDEKGGKERSIFTAIKPKGWDPDFTSSRCGNCGNTINSFKFSQECGFCGSSLVQEIPTNPDAIRPESIVPFKVKKEYALNIFDSWKSKKWFKSKKILFKSINGIYLPYYQFFVYVDTFFAYSYNLNDQDSVGNQLKETVSNFTRTQHTNYIEPASSIGKKKIFGIIDSYDVWPSITYRPEILSGWGAGEMEIELSDAWEKVKVKIMEREREMCYKSSGWHKPMIDIQVRGVNYKIVLLPIWVINFTYKDRPYLFICNGQNKKYASNL